jgi:periplasmic protein TonB
MRALIIAAALVSVGGPALAVVKSQQAVVSEHGIRVASSAPAASSASSSAYIGEVSAAIRSRLFYPRAARARGARGVVFVAFTIGASGALSSFAITRSSGDNDLDAAARTLVQSIRFPPPPGGWVHVTTSFIYVPPR